MLVHNKIERWNERVPKYTHTIDRRKIENKTLNEGTDEMQEKEKDKRNTNDFYDYCHAVLWRSKPSIYFSCFCYLFVWWFRDPLDSLRSKTNWDVCKYSLGETKRTKQRPFCALQKCATKRSKELLVCLFVENENPIVDLGFFLFLLIILRLLTIIFLCLLLLADLL